MFSLAWVALLALTLRPPPPPSASGWGSKETISLWWTVLSAEQPEGGGPGQMASSSFLCRGGGSRAGLQFWGEAGLDQGPEWCPASLPRLYPRGEDAVRWRDGEEGSAGAITVCEQGGLLSLLALNVNPPPCIGSWNWKCVCCWTRVRGVTAEGGRPWIWALREACVG